MQSLVGIAFILLVLSAWLVGVQLLLLARRTRALPETTLGLMLTADSSWDRMWMLVLAGSVGVGYAVADLMPWAMLPDVVDEGELESGERREGLYNGVFTFLRKAGGATAYLLAGVLLDLSGYVKDGEQSASALSAIP